MSLTKAIRLSLAGAALVALTLFSIPLSAQTGVGTFGTILGTVTDATGGVLPGVGVTVTNEATGISRNVVTDDEGRYHVPSLLPSTYSVQAELTGFKKYVQSGIVLRVNESVRADLTLEVGDITETVEVTGQVPLLQTTSGTVGTVVDSTKVVELPLNGRNFVQLTLLTPGAAPGANSGGFFVIGGSSPSVSGNRSDNNNFTLDGVNNNETFFKFEGIRPSVDAIQEFKVQTNITSAQFGASAGANVNVATKAGSNEFHGSAFEFLRNDNLDARDFFARAKPEFKQNQFGGTFGGPILKDRTFFFANYEGFRFRRGSSAFSIVPTAAQLGGDLSVDHTGKPAPPIFDPTTTKPDPNNPGKFIRERFSGNRIPANRINPITQLFAKIIYPTPNLTSLGPGNSNNVNTNSLGDDRDQFTIRADHRLSEKNQLFGRYSDAELTVIEPQTLQTVTRFRTNDMRNLVLSDTWVFSPTAILDFRYGYMRDDIVFHTPTPAPGIGELIRKGLKGLPEKFGKFDYPLNLDTPGFAGAGLFAFTSGPQRTHQWMPNLLLIRGSHTINVGVDFRRQRVYHDGQFNNFGFDTVPTADPQDLANTGQGLASFLLGLPSAASRILGRAEANMKRMLYHGYVQDDIKLTQNLTINLGLRYEYTEWYRSANEPPNASWFDATVRGNDPNPLNRGAFVWAGTNPITGEGPNTRPTFIDPDYNNLAPRLGFAYLWDKQTTIRAGYGIFYESNFAWEGNHMRGNWPYAVGQNVTVNRQGQPLTFVENVFPDLDISKVPPAAQHTANRRNRTPYMQQWNLHIQRELGQDLMLEVGYIGSKGTKLTSFLNGNVADPGPGDPETRRPFPKHAGGFSENQHIANSSYNALTFKAEKQFSQGLTFVSSYAWSRSIDLNSQWGGRSPQNFRNIGADYGLSDFFSKHVSTTSWVYELPIGRGRKFGSSWNTVTDALLGGWQFTGFTHHRSGRPFTIGLTFDNANIGQRSLSQRPNQVGSPVLPEDQRTTRRWFNTDAFALPARFTFGNVGKNTMIGPSFHSWDLGVYKNFRVREDWRIQFRSEFFNAFNNTNFGNPGGSFGTPGFGQITGSAPARQIQFGLRFTF